MDKVSSKISLFSELTVSSDEENLRVPSTTREVTSSAEEGGDVTRMCYDVTSHHTRSPGGYDHIRASRATPLVVRLGRELPQDLMQRKKLAEAAVVMKERRKQEEVLRRKEKGRLERKLGMKPGYMEVTPPPTRATPKTTTRTTLLLSKPRPRVTRPTLDFSKLSLNHPGHDHIRASRGANQHDHIRSSRGANQHDQIRASRGTNQHDQIRASRGTNQHDHIRASRGTNQHDHIRASRGTNQHDHIRASRGTNQHDHIRASRGHLSSEDLRSFLRQSQLARDMLNINMTRSNQVSMVFDERSLQCERLLRKEIRRSRAGKNPTYCVM